ncbi:hypothetical protein [Chryseobacterium culicis]|uniref:hypothetical protein n=1 Tax=Chryseobacterium culicis TaxID=680127 RepID=UPI000B7D7FF3|nr:hypothetical protein [Chryseobacterium culicis]
MIDPGFTGPWTAIYRSNILKNLRSLLERNAVPLGVSTRNAGFVFFGSLTEVIADSQKMGWEKNT